MRTLLKATTAVQSMVLLRCLVEQRI